MAATYQVNLSENLKALWLRSTSDPSAIKNKQFTKYWVVLSSHLPGEASLHFYTSKSAVLRDPAIYVEKISELKDVCHLGYSKKQLILQLNYAEHSILLMFTSAATMKLWKDKLTAFLNSYVLFLLKCPHKLFQTGHCIVSYNDNTLSVYSTKSNELAWKWHVGHLRRYSYEPNVPFVEIEAGRSSETGEGRFFFSGDQSCKLFDRLESLSVSSRTAKRYISDCSNNLSVGTGMPRSISNSIDISRSAGDLSNNLYVGAGCSDSLSIAPRLPRSISNSTDISRELCTNMYTSDTSYPNSLGVAPRLLRSVSDDIDLCRSKNESSVGMDIPRTDSAGYLTVLCPGGASPLANRKFYMEKNKSLPTYSSSHINGKTTTPPVVASQNGSHRNRPPFVSSSSLDIEQRLIQKMQNAPRSHSIPETFPSRSLLQGSSDSSKLKNGSHTPSITIAEIDFNAYDYSDDDDDDDDVNDEYYVNDDEMNPTSYPIKALY